MTAYLQPVGRQSLKCQVSTQRGTGAQRAAGFYRQQIQLFSLAVFSAEFPWSDPGEHQSWEVIVVGAHSIYVGSSRS